MSRSRVAIIEPVGGYGGMQAYDIGMVNGLAASGVDVKLYTSDIAKKNDDLCSVDPVFSGVFNRKWRIAKLVRYLIACTRAIVGAVFDGRRVCHVHIFQLNFNEALLILLCALANRKIIATIHDIESFVQNSMPRGMRKFLYSIPVVCVVHNEICAKELKAEWGRESVVIPHGNYLHDVRDLPDKNVARNNLSIPENSKVLLFFGQIKQVKGLDIALQAMGRICKSRQDIVLLIAGRPWKFDFTLYEKMIHELGIADQCITHLEYIDDDDVPDYFGASDMVLLPYRRIYQSGVALLSMSYSRPVMVSNLEAMTDMVKHGETGFVFVSEDPDSLADGIVKVIDDSKLLDEVSTSAHQYIKSRHDWLKLMQRLSEVYKSVL